MKLASPQSMQAFPRNRLARRNSVTISFGPLKRKNNIRSARRLDKKKSSCVEGKPSSLYKVCDRTVRE